MDSVDVCEEDLGISDMVGWAKSTIHETMYAPVDEGGVG